jgi:hypothetical protein
MRTVDLYLQAYNSQLTGDALRYFLDPGPYELNLCRHIAFGVRGNNFCRLSGKVIEGERNIIGH